MIVRFLAFALPVVALLSGCDDKPKVGPAPDPNAAKPTVEAPKPTGPSGPAAPAPSEASQKILN